VLPNSGSAGPQFDATLLPQLEAAGFAEIRAEWRPSKRGRGLSAHAVRPRP
jgi:hypothetical protein